jgi:hypothetical protein
MPDLPHNCPRSLYVDCLLGVYNAYEVGAIVAGHAASLAESANFLTLEDYKEMIGGVALDLMRNTVDAVGGVPCAPQCPIAIGIRVLSGELGEHP